MSVLIPVLAGLGLFLLVDGLPIFSRTELARRVEPYLNGLNGGFGDLLSKNQLHPRWKSEVVSRLSRFLPPPRPSLSERLLLTGGDLTVDMFRLEQLIWASVALACTVLFGLGAASLEVVAQPASLPVLSGFAGACGWTARDWWLSREVVRRRERVRTELPVALDLLTLSIMAGEAVPAAFARVAGTLPGEVGKQFAHVFGCVRAGTPIGEALQELPRRLPDPSVSRAVDALCTGLERGAPLAETLRAQADDLRDSRRRELIESGGRREVLMLVPVVFLILPAVIAFALVPGLVSLDLLVP